MPTNRIAQSNTAYAPQPLSQPTGSARTASSSLPKPQSQT